MLLIQLHRFGEMHGPEMKCTKNVLKKALVRAEGKWNLKHIHSLVMYIVDWIFQNLRVIVLLLPFHLSLSRPTSALCVPICYPRRVKMPLGAVFPYLQETEQTNLLEFEWGKVTNQHSNGHL